MDSNESHTFGELMLEVAEYLGISGFDEESELPVLPTDRNDLRLCRKRVQEGWERFLDAEPYWHFLDRRHEIVTMSDVYAEDNARYRLPWDFAGIISGDKLAYAPGGPSLAIKVVAEHEFIDLQQGDAPGSGQPWYATVRPLPAVDPATKKPLGGYELVFFPEPTSAYTIIVPFRSQPTRHWDVLDRHPAGAHMNRAVRFACIAEAEARDANMADGPMKAEWLSARLEAKAHNDRIKPRNLGQMRPEPDLPMHRHTHSSFTHNGDAL
jgi:hypothetical protein